MDVQQSRQMVIMITDLFPEIDLRFYEPFILSNAVIEYDDEEKYDVFELFKQLDDLNCKNIEIRFNNKNIDTLMLLLNYISSNKLIISSIGIVIEYSGKLNEKLLLNLAEQENRISYIIIFNSLKNELISSKKTNGMGYIIFTKEKIDIYSCGIVNRDYFVINIKSFTESLNHNSCLHKKIAIDKDGNIKNCPSMIENFGNINDTTLKHALHQPGFKKYWNLTKDSIEVCKDCEFRYICTDCRAYTERSNMNN